MKSNINYGKELLTINKNEIIKTNIPLQLVPAIISTLLILVSINCIFLSMCIYIANSNNMLLIEMFNTKLGVILDNRILGINLANYIELISFAILYIINVFIKNAKYKVKEKDKKYIAYDSGIYEKGKYLSKIIDYTEIKDLEMDNDTIIITSIYNDKKKLRDVEKIEYNFITLKNIVESKKDNIKTTVIPKM